MDYETENRIRRSLARIIEMMVRKDYTGLEILSGGNRLTAKDIETAIAEYGRTLTDPPPEVYDHVDVIQIERKTPSEYSVWFPLFTQEEGRSDLEIRATFIDGDPTAPMMQVQIDDILVP